MTHPEEATELTETFGPWLRQHRMLAKIGLRELSRRSGYSPGYLSRMERGEKPTPVNTGAMLATLLGEMYAEKKQKRAS